MPNSSSSPEKRRFERFPIHASIHIKDTDRHCRAITYSDDLSEGGLAFYSLNPVATGSNLEITIGVRERIFKIEAQAVYCSNRPTKRFYRTGVEFKDSTSAFKAKLAEEVVLIKAYQKQISKETCKFVSEEAAALEWIEKNAAFFGKIISTPKQSQINSID